MAAPAPPRSQPCSQPRSQPYSQPAPQPQPQSDLPRRRDVTGPMPHVVAVISKPYKKNALEEEILAERVREGDRREYARELRVFQHYRNVCDWQKSREHKWLHRAAEEKARAKMRDYLEEIDVRRDRLRELLEEEEIRYLAEMDTLAAMEAQDKEAKMKEQTKLLREKREQERQQLVAEKREQQFRNRCDEFRTLCVRRNKKESSDSQLAQQALKEELKKEEKMEERRLEEICEKELLAKDHQEELEKQKASWRIQEMLSVLDAQVAQLSARKEEEEQLKKEEAEWLEEEKNLVRQEKEELERQKRHKQKECRETLLRAAKDRRDRLNEEKESQLAEEKMILEQDFQDPQRDAEEKTKKKQELLKDQLTYLAHLAEQLEKDKEQEEIDEKLFKEENDQVWAKRAEKMKLEREARFQLLRDVVNTRQEQMKEKLQKKAEKQLEVAEERKLLAETFREYKRLEELKRARKVQKANEYRDQLTSQISYRQHLREEEEKERKREYEAGLEEQREYEKRVQFILSAPRDSILKTHPMRKALMSDS
ncbi:cilia- and flagella-associated protein 53 [Chiroxiphia lanceolata]|uniref:cilia- and flagella-associated protein 53 n=1 Tax=Chiroxiphia lanceolata TaxID=296741 RepID=UPI0013CEE6BE|nr:cilia- and flagella-associated protein 53 [Chiroxiphia lanceolata]